MYTREVILQQIPEEAIYQRYSNYSPREVGKKNVSSPFSKDTNPSFHFYKSRNRLLFKCFSTGYQGDCFELVKRLMNISFFESLQLINRDFNLQLEKQSIDERWKGTSYYDEYTVKAKKYWSRLGVSVSTLQRFCVMQLRELSYEKAFYSFEHNDIFAFHFWINGKLKVYIPKQANYSTKIVFKDQTKDDIFGLLQLPFYKLRYLVITEGEKDCLVLNSAGIPAISLQSSNSILSDTRIRQLYQKAQYIVVIYDNDTPGQKGARKIVEAGNFINYNIPSEFNDIADYLPTIDSKVLKESIEDTVDEFENSLPIKESRGAYYRKTKSGYEPITNFTIEVNYSIVGQQSLKQIILISNKGHRTKALTIPSKLFASPDLFEEFCLNLRGNYDWTGSKRDLQLLRKRLFEFQEFYDEATIGWNRKQETFIFSNRILSLESSFEPNESGICQDFNLYLPFASVEHQDSTEYASIRKIRYLHGQIDVKAYFAILSRNYDDKLAVVSFAWLFASIFFDKVKNLNGNWFPILNLSGQKGSGKGTLAKILMSLYSDFSQVEEISLHQVTPSALSRSFCAIPNMPVWFDEFRNDLPIAKQEALKNAYDMIGKKQAIKSNDNRTKRMDVVSPVILTGQEVPVNEALFSRCINLSIAVREATGNMSQFTTDIKNLNLGLGNMFHSLLGYRKHILSHYSAKMNWLVDYLLESTTERNIKVNVRLVKNYASIFAPLLVAQEKGLTLIERTTDKDMILKIAKNTFLQQVEKEEQIDECSVFLETLTHMATENVIKREVDYRVENGVLSIASICLLKFRKYYYEYHKKLPIDEKTLRSYIKQYDYFKGNSKRYFAEEYSERKKQLRTIEFKLDALPALTKEFFSNL